MAKLTNVRERVHQPFRDSVIRASGYYVGTVKRPLKLWQAALIVLLTAIAIIVGYVGYHILWGRLADTKGENQWLTCKTLPTRCSAATLRRPP